MEKTELLGLIEECMFIQRKYLLAQIQGKDRYGKTRSGHMYIIKTPRKRYAVKVKSRYICTTETLEEAIERREEYFKVHCPELCGVFL